MCICNPHLRSPWCDDCKDEWKQKQPAEPTLLNPYSHRDRLMFLSKIKTEELVQTLQNREGITTIPVLDTDGKPSTIIMIVQCDKIDKER